MLTEAVKIEPETRKLTSREESRRSSLSKLISTARRLFVELGYEAATVRKIATVSRARHGYRLSLHRRETGFDLSDL